MKNLIVRSGGLGDTLLTMPAALSIKEIHPGSCLHILGNPMMLSVSGLFDVFDGFHSSDLACFSNLYSGTKISEEISDFFGQFDSVYFYTTAEHDIIEIKLRQAGIQNINIFDPSVPEGLDYHYSLYLKKIINGLITLNPAELIIPKILFNNGRGKKNGKLLIHPGSGGKLKNWPIERFISVAKTFKERVSFVTGPAEEERGIDEILDNEGYSPVSPESLKELCWVISESSVYLGNDSGVSHLAGFMNIPSVVLFGPTDYVKWRPLGENTHIIVSPDKTMNGISNGTVENKINKLFGLI
jgi:heptosyltransferase III